MAFGDPLDAQQALDVLNRTTDPTWLAGLQSTPDGQAVVNAWVAMIVELSLNLTAQAAAGSISLAPTGSPGTCQLILKRDAADEAFVVPKGYQFKLASGALLGVTQDVPVADGQAVVVLPLATLRQIEFLNTVDPAFDPLLAPGDYAGAAVSPNSPVINTTTGPNHWQILGPPGSTPSSHTLYYVSSTNIVGVFSDWLSVLGDERGQFRQAGEDGEAYRLRVRNIPDAVAPAALSQAVQSVPTALDFPQIVLREPINDGSDVALRQRLGLAFADSVCCDEWDGATPTGFLDDPIGIDLPEKHPMRTLEMPSNREARAYFSAELLGQLHEPDGSVLYCDIGFCDDLSWGYPDIDLYPALKSAIMALPEELNRKRAGGVQFDVYVDDYMLVPAAGAIRGTRTSFGQGLVWYLWSDPLNPVTSATVGWLYRDGLLSHDTLDSSGGPPAPPWMAGAYHYLLFRYRDGSTFATPTNTGGAESNHLTLQKLIALGCDPAKPIVRIEAYVYNPDLAGDFKPALTGTFWMTPYTF